MTFSDEGTILISSMEMEYYHSGKHNSIYKLKPKFDLNPKWKGQIISELELRKLYIEDHIGIRAISEKLGINYKSVKARLAFYGIPIRSYLEAIKFRTYPNGHPTRRKASADDIINLIHSGFTKNEISSRLNICDKSVYDILKKAGCYKDLSPMIKLNAVKKNVMPHGYFSKELGHWVRSTWEEIVENILRENSIKYDYEPFFLPLSKSLYLPDYKIGSIILEVKGYPHGLDTLIEAINTYPEYKFWIIHQVNRIQETVDACEKAYPLFGHHEEIVEEVKDRLIKDLREAK